MITTIAIPYNVWLLIAIVLLTISVLGSEGLHRFNPGSP